MNTPLPKRFNVLLIGDTCKDIYQFGHVRRISPEAPVPVFEPESSEVKWGMGGNVKTNLENLGCLVTSYFGHPSEKERLIDVKTKQHLLRIDRDSFTDAFDNDFLHQEGDWLERYDALVISDYNKGTVGYLLVEWLRKEFAGPIFVDTKKSDLRRFNGCFVKVNEPEYDLAESEPDSRWLIVTNGERGALYEGDQIPAASVPLVDVTGAGDTFLAALCYSYLSTKDIRKAIAFANRAAAVTVQHVGVYAPTLEEIE